MQAIPEISIKPLDKSSFDQDIVASKKPVVLRGLVSDWQIVRQSKQGVDKAYEHLIQHANETPCYTVVGDPSVNGRLFYSDDLQGVNFNAVNAPLNRTLTQLKSLNLTSDRHAISIQAAAVSECLPDLRSSLDLPILSSNIEPTIWISNKSRVATHFDLSDNIACVTTGKRRFVLFPPEQVANLYVGPTLNAPGGVPISLVDLQNPDFKRFPNFSIALKNSYVAELEPGDAIFIPSPWWHAVESLEKLNVLVNYWWNDRVDATGPSANNAMMLAMLTIANMDSPQRLAWKEFFDYFVFKQTGDPARHLPETLNDLATAVTPEQRQMCFDFLKDKL